MGITEDLLEWAWKRIKESWGSDPDAEKNFQALKQELEEHKRNRAGIDNVLRALSSSDTHLWTSVWPTPPFADYNDRIAREPIRGQAKRRPLILTTVNYKGGVGKTTTTANLAAYFARKLGKRVLIIDFDYQGSMTTVLRELAGIPSRPDLIGTLLGEGAPAELLARCTFPLGPQMPHAFMVPAFYPLARVEERVMVEWLLHRTGDDVRYRLARILLDDHLSDRFDVVLIDAAPRLTTATINALCASTHVLVPAIMNRLSAEPVVNFLKETQQVLSRLNPRLSYVGIVETMAPPANERQEPREVAVQALDKQLSDHGLAVPRLQTIISRRPALTEGRVAYLNDREVRDIFDALGEEITSKVGALP